jgi:hypothetical protein
MKTPASAHLAGGGLAHHSFLCAVISLGCPSFAFFAKGGKNGPLNMKKNW